MDLPNKRPDDMARITTIELANKFIDEQVQTAYLQEVHQHYDDFL